MRAKKHVIMFEKTTILEQLVSIYSDAGSGRKVAGVGLFH